MKRYQVTLTEESLAFARELVNSKLAVTIDNVEIVAEFKKAIRDAQPVPESASDVGATSA